MRLDILGEVVGTPLYAVSYFMNGSGNVRFSDIKEFGIIDQDIYFKFHGDTSAYYPCANLDLSSGHMLWQRGGGFEVRPHNTLWTLVDEAGPRVLETYVKMLGKTILVAVSPFIIVPIAKKMALR